MSTQAQRLEALAQRIEPIDEAFAARLRCRINDPEASFMGGFEVWMASVERMTSVVERQHQAAQTGRVGDPIQLEPRTLYFSTHYPEIAGRHRLPAWLLVRIDSAVIELGRQAADKGFLWQDLHSAAPHDMQALKRRHSEMMGTAARLAREVEYMLKGRNMGSPKVAETYAVDLAGMLQSLLGEDAPFTILDLVPAQMVVAAQEKKIAREQAKERKAREKIERTRGYALF